MARLSVVGCVLGRRWEGGRESNPTFPAYLIEPVGSSPIVIDVDTGVFPALDYTPRAPGRNRTYNLRIKSPLLCQLSYRG